MPKADGFVPEGKVWVAIKGLYYDDLFELDASTPEEEIAEARRQFKARFPQACVIKSVERITNQEGT